MHVEECFQMKDVCTFIFHKNIWKKEIIMIFIGLLIIFHDMFRKKWHTGNKGTSDTSKIDDDRNNSSDCNDDGKIYHYQQPDVKDNFVETSINSDEEQDWRKRIRTKKRKRMWKRKRKRRKKMTWRKKRRIWLPKKKDKVPAEMNDMDDFVAAMNHYETEKVGLPPMSIKMEAGIELLSIIRQPNATMQLSLKIVKWTDQYYIKSWKST